VVLRDFSRFQNLIKFEELIFISLNSSVI